MKSEVSKAQFKGRAHEYFRTVESSGQSLVVTHRWHPKLEVRPYQPHARQPLEILRDSVLRFDRPTAPVAEEDWESLG